MTITIAQRLQRWFTTPMTTFSPTKRGDRRDVYTKAADILSEPGRVQTFAAKGTDYWMGSVVGDHGTYAVVAVDEDRCEHYEVPVDGRLRCKCRAGQRGVLCSHAIVAEEMRCRGDDR